MTNQKTLLHSHHLCQNLVLRSKSHLGGNRALATLHLVDWQLTINYRERHLRAHLCCHSNQDKIQYRVVDSPPFAHEKRKERLAKLFSEFIVPFTDKALSRQGLKELAAKEEVFLLPAVKAELV